MGKRGNGEGSIPRRKDRPYMASYTVQTADGPKRRTIYGKKRREARKRGGVAHEGRGRPRRRNHPPCGKADLDRPIEEIV